MKSIPGIFILLFIGLHALEAQTTYEVFPLKKNLHYSYDYYFQGRNTQALITWTIAVDSGVVDYVIKDSLRVNDTTMSWSVLEIRDLYRWRQIPDETTYTIRDTAALTLIENTRGLHALTISSLVWKFPLGDSSHIVYRFDSSHMKEMSRLWEDGSHPPFITTIMDTIRFNDSAGLYNASSYYINGTPRNSGSEITNIRLLSLPVTAVENDHHAPTGFALEQNYPNPFNPATTINYRISSASHVTLTVFDVVGREIATLVNEQKQAGSYAVRFISPMNTSGMYFYKFRAGNYTETRKMMLMK